MTRPAGASGASSLPQVLDPGTLRFRDRALESAYQVEGVEAVRREARTGAVVSIGLWLVATVLIPNATGLPASLSTPITLSMAVVSLVALLPIHRMRTLDQALILLLALNVLTGIALITLAAQTGQFDRYGAPAVMLQSTFALFIARRFLLTLIATTVEVGMLAVVANARDGLPAYSLDLFIVISAVTVGVGATYVIEAAARIGWYQRRVISEQGRQLELEKDKSDRLLRNVLPERIADRLKQREATIADAIPSATVLFADLVGFTPLAGRSTAGEVVGLLDALFGAFDEATDHLGLEKIKTIGDAYMAAGGLLGSEPDHAERVVRLGLSMLETTKAFAVETGLPLELRIGVHSGPLVAGVIGHRRLSYDLWGDTVNTASRMESHGVVGAVHISRATADLLGPAFRTVPRGVTSIKGKGDMETFVVTGAIVAVPV